MKPEITFLIGAPGSGKSTYVLNNIDINKNIIISRDNIVERISKEYGLTYSESFGNKEIQNSVDKELNDLINKSISENNNIVVDMTNMNKKSRSRILNKCGDEYHKKAIVFNVDRDELIRRLEYREKKTGKHISLVTLDMMLNKYEEPDKNEFDHIIYYHTQW